MVCKTYKALGQFFPMAPSPYAIFFTCFFCARIFLPTAHPLPPQKIIVCPLVDIVPGCLCSTHPLATTLPVTSSITIMVPYKSVWTLLSQADNEHHKSYLPGRLSSQLFQKKAFLLPIQTQLPLNQSGTVFKLLYRRIETTLGLKVCDLFRHI